jgi:hypothetical protein
MPTSASANLFELTTSRLVSKIVPSAVPLVNGIGD